MDEARVKKDETKLQNNETIKYKSKEERLGGKQTDSGQRVGMQPRRVYQVDS